MFKRIEVAIGVIGAVLALTVPAQAQIMPVLENFSLTLGIGSSVPLRAEAFVDGYKPAFYRVLNAEYAVNGFVSLFGAYDRSIFDPTTEGAPQIDVTAWGGGVILFFDLKQGSAVRGFAKIGGMSNLVEGGNPEWTAPVGAGIDWKVSPQASIRLGGDMRTLSNSDRIDAVQIQALLNLRPGKS